MDVAVVVDEMVKFSPYSFDERRLSGEYGVHKAPVRMCGAGLPDVFGALGP